MTSSNSTDMEFVSADPSVVRSIKQRVLLNTWLRAPRGSRPFPAIGDFHPDGIADELAEMMAYEVQGEGETARFLIMQEGSRLAATYGSEHIDPDKRTNRYLDDAIGPERYARVLPCYRACLIGKRPPIRSRDCRTATASRYRSSACCCRSAGPTGSSTS
jgi:hypothetical protein